MEVRGGVITRLFIPCFSGPISTGIYRIISLVGSLTSSLEPGPQGQDHVFHDQIRGVWEWGSPHPLWGL